MIRDAGFEIAGNPLYDEERRGDGESAFRLPGADDEILKPDIARGD